MYGIVRTYKYDKANGDAIARFAAEFHEILKQHEGYVSHYWIDSGDGEGVSMAIWDTKEEAEASSFLAGGFVHDHLLDLMPNPPRIIEGQV